MQGTGVMVCRVMGPVGQTGTKSQTGAMDGVERGIRRTRGRDDIGVHQGRELMLGRGVKGGDSVQKEDFRGRRNSKGRSDRDAKGGNAS